MAGVEISYEFVREAMQSKPVRAGLAAKAKQVHGRAEQLAQSEGENMGLDVEHGTRPKGRPYSRVVSPDGAAQEWGTSVKERRRILGRAAESA